MTERKMFEPADGVSPRWRKLYDLVISREVGDEVTYREAGELVNLNHRDRDELAMIQQSMRKAMEHLEQDCVNTVRNVARFGWIIASPSTEVDLTDKRVTKTRRAAGRGVRLSVSVNTRRGELSQFERERLDRLGWAARMAQQMTSRRKPNMTDLKRQIEGNSETA